ncbi:ubiquitin carboxy terminal hydrolase Ubp10 [Schizosaccharomyces cryophilus OY26]|uniref:Ubiquitin carboxy terminal hydrolase Ubp10 n=1 Tax=Schizosaccharomyces cryophilus (strain OY26 / ATCC MYA-4695 / CBS 11777 / NBRC 106824 / NRRL Y48691) TaxID=653667 RepID=S9VNF0_SCHCR|nr:ubiquitin carboxy terminal hydrolase Ubp10 [Schizosaccharomyces cryophilus OY26]EPY49473.1 ubiquitin carboxy terminal hydrolase Ubp10 [Schizosaccharomyces cryophilus OY26]
MQASEINKNKQSLKRPLEDEDADSMRKREKVDEVSEATSKDNETATTASVKKYKPISSDLYLDTINRKLLDFDFEKVCSVSLTNLSVYACLVCGRYFQGRGPSSHAYFHALNDNHHVFVNCSTLKFYILPESYQVESSALHDIAYVMKPTYTREEVAKLDRVPQVSYDLMHKPYVPGFVGLNNIKSNDYFNVILHLLSHVKPLRNYLLLNNFDGCSQVIQRLAITVRKIWNPKAFKGHVSPQELIHEVTLLSHKKYSMNEQKDPLEFLSWLLNTLHVSLGGKKSTIEKPTSIIHYNFQGHVRVESQKIRQHTQNGDHVVFEGDRVIKTDVVPYLYLTLNLPPRPLFQDEFEGNIIPQVELVKLLEKYNGVTTQELSGMRRRFHLMNTPPYLLFHMKRFMKNNYFTERNPTIVTFPLDNLDMSPFIDDSFLKSHPKISPRYNLIANIVYESVLSADGETHVFRVQLRNPASNKWYQIQDLYVEEISSDMINLGESLIQLWERAP